MDEVLSQSKQSLVFSFLEIAVGQTANTAREFLQATSWNLEEAIQLFYSAPAPATTTATAATSSPAQSPELETDYQNGFSASAVDNSGDNLGDLYPPPFDLMYQGPFHSAKDTARVQNKWLLVSVQSMGEFSSHLLNRHTWANEAVAQIINSNNFIFWLVYDYTEEGKKVCSYYKLLQDSNINLPTIMVIDPITGQKLRSLHGMVQPQTLLENLLPFMDGSPTDYHANLSSKHRPNQVQDHAIQEKDEDIMLRSELPAKDIDDIIEESEQIPAYPALPEEPKGGDRNLVCRVGVRVPDGRRLQRNFLLSDPLQLLWSFIYSQLEEEAKTRPFRLTQAIPGSSKSFDYNTDLTFEASGIANCMISVTWL